MAVISFVYSTLAIHIQPRRCSCRASQLCYSKSPPVCLPLIFITQTSAYSLFMPFRAIIEASAHDADAYFLAVTCIFCISASIIIDARCCRLLPTYTTSRDVARSRYRDVYAAAVLIAFTFHTCFAIFSSIEYYERRRAGLAHAASAAAQPHLARCKHAAPAKRADDI